MARTHSKQFHYEVQAYQEECVANIVDLFKSLHQRKPFAEILGAHKDKNNYSFPVQDTNNIDIMMETGTGKTFTFIKTILELCHNFDYRKFIILVPSVPIREGTKAHLGDTREYFKTLYSNEKDKEIEVFVYESGNVSAINQFINTSHLSVLIMTPGSFRSKDNILNRPLDRDINAPNLFETNSAPPKTYLECLQRLRPIVIMDEPHRFEGDAFKKYFKGFDNYYLRFGATFPRRKNSLVLSNVAYVLDSISSFRQNLVKKIVVYTQGVVSADDTLVGIESVGSRNTAIVDTFTNGVTVRREVSPGGVFNGRGIRRINKDSIVLTDDTIVKVDYSLADDSLRAMISETIRIHLAKEQALFMQGVKALTLFFIESDITLYRGDNPRIKSIFEEEYARQHNELLATLDQASAYYSYLRKAYDENGDLLAHQGYFSGDKGTTDDKIKAGVEEILINKRALLSTDSPTRFIFSIWALQEGWDNPNVFTICKLSNQGSEISKLQQIGRGLRICVDQELQRKTIAHLDNDQERFWNINNLDVVVSSMEQGFVEAIQNEILENSFLVPDTFTEQDLLRMLVGYHRFSEDDAIALVDDVLVGKRMVVRKALVDGLKVYQRSPDYHTILRSLSLPEKETKALENLFASDTSQYVKKSALDKPKKKIYIKPSHLQEFQELWRTVSQNASFMIDSLAPEQQDQLIANIAAQIESLNIEQLMLQTLRQEVDVETLGSDVPAVRESISSHTYDVKIDYLALIHTLSTNTKTPLAFVVKLFNVLSFKFKTEVLVRNPEQAQREIAEIVKRNLIDMIKTKVKYDGMDGTVLPNIFKTDQDGTYLEPGSTGRFQKEIESSFPLKTKWVFEDVIEYDSDFELAIVEQDPDIGSIEIFGKLPRLRIKTPLGEYNPDFCYAIKGASGNKLFLIVEAKGYGSSTAIPPDEKGKIAFAKEYFKALAKHCEGSGIKISYKERINRTQLAALIRED